jgi:hypothetical protein
MREPISKKGDDFEIVSTVSYSKRTDTQQDLDVADVYVLGRR